MILGNFDFIFRWREKVAIIRGIDFDNQVGDWMWRGAGEIVHALIILYLFGPRKLFLKILFHVFCDISLANAIASACVLMAYIAIKRMNKVQRIVMLIFPFNGKVILASDVPMGKDRSEFFHAAKIARAQSIIKLYYGQKYSFLFACNG